MTNCPDCNATIEIGMWPLPCKGRGHDIKPRDAQIHASEKMVVYEGPSGEIRIPGRADRPMNPKYAALGYRRREIDTISGVKEIERKTGKVSEVLNYDRNSARADRDTGAL